MLVSSGLGSGLDIEGLVSQLVAAERAPAQRRIDRQEASLSVRLSALGSLRGATADFLSTLRDLNSESTFDSRSISSTDLSIVTASVSKDALEGSYDIQVNQLAQRHSLSSSSFSGAASPVGTGTLTIRQGSYSADGSQFFVDPNETPVIINIDSSNNTLEGVKQAINAADAGVSASVINDGGGYRLVVRSDETGVSQGIELNVSDDDGNDTDTSGLSVLAFNETTKNLNEQQKGQDALINVNGIDVTRSSNSATDIIDSVTLNFLEIGSSTVNVTTSTGNAGAAVRRFVSSYNDLRRQMDGLTAYDPATQIGGPLNGSATVRLLESNLRSFLQSTGPSSNAAIKSLADIGVVTERDGNLRIDETALSDALDNNLDEVIAYFAPSGVTSDALIRFSGSTANSDPGTYDVVITQFTPAVSATSGYIAGAANSSLVVDANNDTFELSVDGVATGTITLTQGTYATLDALADEIETQINNDANLQSAGSTVTVSAEGGALTITSNRRGASSSVDITSVDTNTAATIGFSTGTGTVGTDEVEASVEGTIGGVSAIASGNTLTGQGIASGVQIEVLGGATGSRGNIVFSEGMFSGFEEFLDELNDSDGVLGSQVTALTDQISDLSDDRDQLNFRMGAVEQRYRRQFTDLDILLNQLQTTGDFLVQQLASLPSINGNR